MIKLGQKVTDSVTGFTGVVTSRYQHLTGPDQYRVTAKCVDNACASSMDFDEERLLAVNVTELVMMKGEEVEA